MTMNWRPTADWSVLVKRAELMRQVRQFFYERQITEVDTHLLSQFGVTDCHLNNLTTEFKHPLPSGKKKLYLQTSPEYAMKRILAAYGQDIFQLSHVVRDDEIGRFHNPEFTLLEWYRVGYDDVQLITEVSELLTSLCGAPETKVVTYQQAFIEYLGVDPLSSAGVDTIRRHLVERPSLSEWMSKETDEDTILQVAFSELIESQFPDNRPICVTEFPQSQAALARIDSNDARVARRFEFYYRGVELANGYHELSDAAEQRVRFKKDNEWRERHGREIQPEDTRLLDALDSGLPACSGVALGFDRLLMIICGANTISEVLPFAIDTA
ncbi:elongation factor P--(R)-beta-lysine ligase [Idiomarina abyssalis]|uniref:elongation factor P--(R)-beta-lysine ligase n=1 Tax=Idiomarina abyssalis TaxID=86102 RepID=UPI001C970243|nr:elongation factor P--(R)-beta-lysine ligase [Idiomarina abyssalis]MDA6067945.1 elongation factor P--(R)-beta-lysine ligase [Idiomarina abyssalis]QZN90624.1 elongation factor P--(R)-beta-lysine ligase [Idiomarina abyssalis]